MSVFISELDVPVGADVADRAEQQAERYRRAAATCLAVPACNEIIVWGVSDRASWLDQVMGPGYAPLLFDVDLQPKAAYRAVRDALLEGRPAPEPDPPTTAPTTSSTTTAPPRDDPVDGPPPSVPAPPPASAVSAEPTFAG